MNREYEKLMEMNLEDFCKEVNNCSFSQEVEKGVGIIADMLERRYIFDPVFRERAGSLKTLIYKNTLQRFLERLSDTSSRISDLSDRDPLVRLQRAIQAKAEELTAAKESEAKARSPG